MEENDRHELISLDCLHLTPERDELRARLVVHIHPMQVRPGAPQGQSGAHGTRPGGLRGVSPLDIPADEPGHGWTPSRPPRILDA
jgi:hypothetical protein